MVKKTAGPRSVNLRELERLARREAKAARKAGLPVVPLKRLLPRTRAECVDGPRPCPYVSCRYHLFLHVTDAGSIVLNHGQDVDVLHRMHETCSLDVADTRVWRRPLSMEPHFNIDRNRVMQIEEVALAKLRRYIQAQGLSFGDFAGMFKEYAAPSGTALKPSLPHGSYLAVKDAANMQDNQGLPMQPPSNMDDVERRAAIRERIRHLDSEGKTLREIKAAVGTQFEVEVDGFDVVSALEVRKPRRRPNPAHVPVLRRREQTAESERSRPMTQALANLLAVMQVEDLVSVTLTSEGQVTTVAKAKL